MKNRLKKTIEYLELSLNIQLVSTKAMIHANGRKKLGRSYLREIGQRIVAYKEAIKALKEKQERNKGCDLCYSTFYMEDKDLDGVDMINNKFCPFCGNSINVKRGKDAL